MTVGERIKFIRQQMNLNQTDFAKMMGVSRASITRYEGQNDSSNLSVDFLAKLQKSGWNVGWILTGDGDREFNVFLTQENFEQIYADIAACIMATIDYRLNIKKIDLNTGFKANILAHCFITATELVKDNRIDIRNVKSIVDNREIYVCIDRLIDVFTSCDFTPIGEINIINEK